MPPKRKAPEADTEPSSSGRATRSSTRLSGTTKSESSEASKSKTTKTTKTTKATASKSKKTTAEKEDDAPPAKKAKATKTKAAPKTAKGRKGPNRDDEEDENAPSTGKAQTQIQTADSSQTTSKANVYTPAGALKLFKDYADDDDENVIGPEGLEKLCNDAEIPLDGAMPMILAWQFEASEMMKFTKEEWTKGTASLKISSLPILQTALTDLDELLIQDKTPKNASTPKTDYDKSAYRTYASDKKAAFQKLYMFCFNLVKPEQSRNIDMETASVLWTVLLAPKYPLVKEVVDFIQEKGSYKAVNKDLWNMMLEFCETVKPDLSNYEADGAWPTLLDDFVASKKNGTESTE